MNNRVSALLLWVLLQVCKRSWRKLAEAAAVVNELAAEGQQPCVNRCPEQKLSPGDLQALLSQVTSTSYVAAWQNVWKCCNPFQGLASTSKESLFICSSAIDVPETHSRQLRECRQSWQPTNNSDVMDGLHQGAAVVIGTDMPSALCKAAVQGPSQHRLVNFCLHCIGMHSAASGSSHIGQPCLTSTLPCCRPGLFVLAAVEVTCRRLLVLKMG